MEGDILHDEYFFFAILEMYFTLVGFRQADCKVALCPQSVFMSGTGREHLYLPAGIRWGLESGSGLRVSLELCVSLSEAQVLCCVD